MKIGMNLLLWTTHVTEEHFPLFGKLKQAGFDGVELPLFGGDAAHYKTVRKQLDDHGLGCTTVTVVDAGRQPDQPRRRPPPAPAVERMKWAIEMTAMLGGENLCGPYHSPLGVFSGTGPTADEKKRAAEVLRKAAEEARKNKVMLCHRVPQPLRVLLPHHRRRREGARQAGGPSPLPHDVRHLPRQHRGEARRPGHRARCWTASATSTSARTTAARPAPATSHWDETFKALAQGRLRRLDGDRVVRPGAAGPGGGDEGVARPVPVGGRGVYERDPVYQGKVGRGEVTRPFSRDRRGASRAPSGSRLNDPPTTTTHINHQPRGA